MINCQKIAGMLFAALFLASCADFAIPVTVLPPKPEHEGSEPTNFGVACAHRIFWVVSFGDSRIREAKKNGGVKDVATVEVLQKSLPTRTFPLNFYQRQCTEVAGYS
ncbi:MAG: TRL domain-containing protein [Geminicoccaceae bacterium]